jgi:hypothetical protein
VALKAKMQGRAALMRRLNELAPNAERYAAEAKLEAVKEAANLISADAPHDSGEYMTEIKGERQADNPNIAPVVGRKSKDPDATAVYAPWIWRFLEFGTKAHINKGRFAGTQHPGTPAQPHVFPTWRAFKPRAKKMVNAAINRAVREVTSRR